MRIAPLLVVRGGRPGHRARGGLDIAGESLLCRGGDRSGPQSVDVALQKRSVAVLAFQKQLTKQALTKTSWYPVMKHCLRYIGINLTKKSFAQGVSKVIPVIGGVVSGGMTFVSLQSQSTRLKGHLRELPPPGVDAEEWKQAVSEATPDDQEPGVLDGAQQALESTTKAVASGAKTAATGIADGAMTAASGIAEGVKGLFGRRK